MYLIIVLHFYIQMQGLFKYYVVQCKIKPDAPVLMNGWLPQVLCYSGFYGTGVKEIWDMIYEYIDFVKANGYFDYRRNEQSKYWMYESINEHLRLNFYNNPAIKAQLSPAEQTVLAGQKTSFVAAQDLLDMYFDMLKNHGTDRD